MNAPFIPPGTPLPERNYATAKIKLPTLHRAQARLRWLMTQARFVVARCGRRWGKNVLGESIAVDDAAKGRLVGWFAPENKRLSESYNVIVDMIDPAKKSSDKTHGMIRTITGGAIEFWSLEDENAGRSRKYHRVILDEAAFTKPKKMIDTWRKSIRPTLVDYRGRALVMSNTNGIDPENFLYKICHDPAYGFVQFHAPSRSNPHLPADEVAGFERDNAPMVYQQEYLAEFVDWSGDAFFARDALLTNGEPIEVPARCETVFATIDTATKTGKGRDGTAVIYWALMLNPLRAVGPTGIVGPRYTLAILDWDVTQIEGRLLEFWLPNVFEGLKTWSIKCRSRTGSTGAFIEDKASGMVLIQQARARGWPAQAIDSKLTALGKDERAISVSGYVYRGLVKMTRPAYDKVSLYKEAMGNHLLTQVTGFRIGDKDRNREDDLLDDFTYGIAIALGNSEGF